MNKFLLYTLSVIVFGITYSACKSSKISDKQISKHHYTLKNDGETNIGILEGIENIDEKVENIDRYIKNIIENISDYQQTHGDGIVQSNSVAIGYHISSSYSKKKNNNPDDPFDEELIMNNSSVMINNGEDIFNRYMYKDEQKCHYLEICDKRTTRQKIWSIECYIDSGKIIKYKYSGILPHQQEAIDYLYKKLPETKQ